MRVCFVPRNIDGAGWYRCLFPAEYLRQRGHWASHPPMGFSRQGQELPLVNGQLPDGWVDVRFGDWPDADIYVLQMPIEPGQPEQVKTLQRRGKKVVVELDDDYTCLPAYNPFDVNLYGDPGSGTRYLNKCVELADAVTVSTPSLRRSYKRLNRNITVLRNRLFWPMWANIVPVYEQTWKKIRVGYMGVLGFHSADLDVLKPWFGKWLSAHPEVEFVAAGDQRVHDYLNVPPSQRVGTDSVDYRHLELANVTATFDIGLVPLAKNRFNEGKSYLKGLEYSACGIVPICTPTQQYRELIEPNINGFLAERPKEWVAALDALVAHPQQLRSMGVVARNRVRDEYTYEKTIGEWEAFYTSLCADSVSSRTLWTPERVPA